MICFDTSILFTSVTECKAESVYGRQYLLTCFICLTFVSPLMFSQSYQPLKRSEAQVSDFLNKTNTLFRALLCCRNCCWEFLRQRFSAAVLPPLPSCPVRPVCLGAVCYLLCAICVVFYVLSVTCALCALVLLMQILRNGPGNLSSMWEL